MKNLSGHIYFDDSFNWKSLEKVFPLIFDDIAEKGKQTQEEIQHDQVRLELNMREIREGKKPLGYNSENSRLKLIFPIDKKEMIIIRNYPSEDIAEITEKIAKILKAKKIKFKTDLDKTVLSEIIKKRK
ncbi:MAG: hypothetical protein ACYCR7_01465 [Thermoplasmataceae archaeon]